MAQWPNTSDDDAAVTPLASFLSNTGHPLRRLKIEPCVWYVCQLSDALILTPTTICSEPSSFGA